MHKHKATDMDNFGSKRITSLGCLFSIIFLILFIPTPVQALCNSAESCGMIGGFFLSIISIPISLFCLILAIWPNTRNMLTFISILPGSMAIITFYLMVIQGQRFDLIFVPLIHLGILGLMLLLSRLGKSNVENSDTDISS